MNNLCNVSFLNWRMIKNGNKCRIILNNLCHQCSLELDKMNNSKSSFATKICLVIWVIILEGLTFIQYRNILYKGQLLQTVYFIQYTVYTI